MMSYPSIRFANLVVLDKFVKFRYPCLSRSREVSPEAVGGGIFDIFRYKFRPEVVNDVISDVAIDYVSRDVQVKLGDSRSNYSRVIRVVVFVSNERTIVYAYRLKIIMTPARRWIYSERRLVCNGCPSPSASVVSDAQQPRQ